MACITILLHWERRFTNTPTFRSVSFSLVIPIRSGVTGGALLIGAGVVYGIVIDLVSTKFYPGQN